MKPLNLIKTLIDKTREIKVFKPLGSIFDALQAALLGTDETTDCGPHLRDGLDIKRYMTVVIVGLMPAVIASIYLYGWRMLAIIMVSYISGAVVEIAFAVVRKHGIHEGFLVTGLIFPLTLPPTVPLWVVVVGMVAGTLFGKEVFGGTGRNIFNPALVGRLFITISFPAIMTTAWQVPMSDAITTATPLVLFKGEQIVTSASDLLLGLGAGSMGEGFRIGLILGGLLLIYARVSDWRIPVTYIGVVAALSALGSHMFPLKVAPPVFQLLSGGLILGAFFMATDPVTSPFSKVGKYIYGSMCGLLTVVIRGFSGYVEGVMFSIVIMNALSPLIDYIVVKLQFRAPKAAAVDGAV
jgi:RnfABCDGE-type electron transport complex D subunit